MRYLFIIFIIVVQLLQAEPVTEQQWQEEKKDFEYKPKKEEAPKKQTQDEPSDSGKTEVADSNFNFKLPAFFSNPNVLYGFIFIIVLVVLALLLRNITIPQKLTKEVTVYEDENIEDKLMETDIDRLIRLALENNNFQLAIRYTFLKTLKTLAEKNQLIWKKQYTNRDYLIQLYQTPYFEPFKSITLTYERKWYGDDISTREEFESYRNHCNKIYGSI